MSCHHVGAHLKSGCLSKQLDKSLAPMHKLAAKVVGIERVQRYPLSKLKMSFCRPTSLATSDSSMENNVLPGVSSERKDERHAGNAQLGGTEPVEHSVTDSRYSTDIRRLGCHEEARTHNIDLSGLPVAPVSHAEHEGKRNSSRDANDDVYCGTSHGRNTQVAFILLQHYAKVTEEARDDGEAGQSSSRERYKLNVVSVIKNFFDQVPELRDE